MLRAYALALLGVLVLLTGVWWIYPPVALILGGAAIVALSVTLLRWDPKAKPR